MCLVEVDVLCAPIDSATLVFFIGTSLLMTIIVVIATTIFVGPFAILGCGIYILFIPLQSLMAKLSGRLRRKGTTQI